jgi:hypothetical protein
MQTSRCSQAIVIKTLRFNEYVQKHSIKIIVCQTHAPVIITSKQMFILALLYIPIYLLRCVVINTEI